MSDSNHTSYFSVLHPFSKALSGTYSKGLSRGDDLWSPLSVSTSDPSLSWLCPFDKSKVSPSFCEGS